MKDPIIIWDNPPSGGGRALRHEALVLAVMKRPDTWAQAGRRPTMKEANRLAGTLRNPGYKRLASPGRLRVVARRIADDDFGVWIKYVPAGEANA